ncbi:DUF1572 domain-containing protein [Aliifodinibius salicampi]|uniref:DUF1572 domain-containing protein n=1 Tax=Fodinibius salicampi TaxID=1920655 RepID=A0ABT3PVB3_9BACT|nr:DinB family protein [Fodinibius salicampi]MCW9711751.1 DUF1572 domain-containing protein [Fodinibius salicampi]
MENSLQRDLRTLYMRDLDQLIDNIEAIPEDLLWNAPEGVTNSCGVLVQHLVGNLNHYIGEGIGETGYVRQREQEFTTTQTSKKDLIADVESLQRTLDTVFDTLEDSDLSEEYPLETSYEFSTRGFLIHLYGHLNYHLGQINYLGRLLSERG